jgi:hypothetical protein
MWKKILLGFLALIAALVVFVFYATSGMTDAAEGFFKEVQAHNYDKAYAMLSEDFRRSTSEQEMIAFLKQNGLDTFQSASWGNRSFEGKRGQLEGSITTASGGAVPLKISFVEAADGTWQIYSIVKPAAGTKVITDDKTTSATQTQSEQKSAATTQNILSDTKAGNNSSPAANQPYIDLVRGTIRDFAVSINQKSMAQLRNNSAKLFRDQVGLETFDQAFATYMKLGVDFTALDAMQPHFTSEPRIDENGGLHLEGYYETKPKRFYFSLIYTQEEGQWKLVDIHVDIR